MAIDETLVNRIEQRLASLNSAEFQRPGRSYLVFVTEYSELIGQTKEDIKRFVAAKMQREKIDEAEALIQLLMDVHGKRIALQGDKADVVEIFDERMPSMQRIKKVLMHASQFILEMTGNLQLTRTYNKVKKGWGDVDTLDDISTLVPALKQFPEMYAMVAPGGVEISEEYLNNAKAQALEMLGLHGDANAASDQARELVDRQQRIMTLCVQSERLLKLYARMAFMDDDEHYNKHYASEAFRKSGNSSSAPEQEVTPDDQELSAEENAMQ